MHEKEKGGEKMTWLKLIDHLRIKSIISPKKKEEEGRVRVQEKEGAKKMIGKNRLIDAPFDI